MKHHKMEDLGAVAEVVRFSVTRMSRKERSRSHSVTRCCARKA